MKSFVALLALVAVVSADVAHILSEEAKAEILGQNSDVQPDKYSYAYKTSNGISAEGSAVLKQVGPEEVALVAKGSSSYTAPDGTPVEISYVADENGYQPQGALLPTPPPPQEIPEYIVRALKYIADHPPKPETNQRNY